MALSAYLVFSLSHLAFHLTHLMGLSAAGKAFLVIGLSFLPATAAGLLVLTTRRPGPDAHRGENPDSGRSMC